jgi:hypothetical protein
MHGNGRDAPISLKKSAGGFDGYDNRGHRRKLASPSRRRWLWHWDELGEFPEVLGRGCKVELITSAVRSSQSQPIELQDAFEVGEQHLNFFALTARGSVAPVLAISRAISRAPSCEHIVPLTGSPEQLTRAGRAFGVEFYKVQANRSPLIEASQLRRR